MRTKFPGILFAAAMVLTACAPQVAAPVVPVTSVQATTIPAAPETSVPAVTGSEVKIEISGFAFNPATVTIKVGETVTWTNQDGAVHTVVADDNSWTSDSLGQGASFSHTFDTAGTFTYRCGVHPAMKGTVIVQP
jgi:plastocyanin